jgi:hypothetical protein
MVEGWEERCDGEVGGEGEEGKEEGERGGRDGGWKMQLVR